MVGESIPQCLDGGMGFWIRAESPDHGSIKARHGCAEQIHLAEGLRSRDKLVFCLAAKVRFVSRSNSGDKERRYTESEQREICLEYKKGKITYRFLAKKYDVSEETLRLWRKKFGLDSADGSKREVMGSNPGTQVTGNGSSLQKKIMSISEASTLIGVTTDQLLEYAALGSVKVCFPVDPRMIPVHDREINVINNNSSVMVPVTVEFILANYYIDYLVVDRVDCLKIQVQGFSIQSRFESGYKLTISGSIFHMVPDSFYHDKGMECQYFYLLMNYNPHVSIKIDLPKHGVRQTLVKEMLFVTTDELVNLEAKESERHAARSGWVDELATNPSMSTLLVNLDQAAFQLWGDFNPIRSRKYSTPESVADFLVSNFGFFARHAKSAARMILPDQKFNPQTNGGFSYRTRMLQDLIHAWITVCMGRSFERGDQTNFDKAVEQILESMNSSIVSEQELIYIAMKIIAPDVAPFHNPRKPKASQDV